MKRNYQHDERGGGGKRGRDSTVSFNDAMDQGKFLLRILIPTKVAGLIIGKGGENINALSKKYDATMNVPDKQTPERVLAIMARPDSIMDCFTDVFKLITEEHKRMDMEARLIVHQSHAGVVLGQKAANVRELSSKTNTKISVHKELCPNSTERIVLITGKSDGILEAVASIIKSLADVPTKGADRQYDSANYDPRLADLYGGYPSSRTDDYRSPRARGGRDVVERNGSSGYGRAPEEPSPWQSGYGDPYGRPPRVDPYARPARPGGMMYAEESVQLAIPKEMTGRVIGNAGEMLSRLQHESGAKISLNVTISGSGEQIDVAQQLIKTCIRKTAMHPGPYYEDRIPDESVPPPVRAPPPPMPYYMSDEASLYAAQKYGM